MNTDWLRRAVVYHILIDRFSGFSSDRWEEPVFCGGTLRGVIEKLPYLADLGVDALYLSPFCAGTAYHGYHVADYYSVDPRFGTEADFRELAVRAHEARLRLIVDFVPNHVSRVHPFFAAAAADPQSPYRGWFFFNDRSGRYRTFLDIGELPKLNLDHPGARAHVIGAAVYWLERGADGLRIDHAIGPSREFLKALRREVKRRRPDAVIVAEAWFPRPPFRFLSGLNLRGRYVRFFTRSLSQERIQRDGVGLFDGALDFAARDLFLRHCARTAEPVDGAALARDLARHYHRYPAGFFLPAFLDNHDTNRFYHECGHDREKYKATLALLLGLDRPVFLYYGTETGLSQDKAIRPDAPYADLQARRIMNWDSPDKGLVDWVKELIRQRKSRIA